MFSFSAFNRTVILLSSVLIMAALWGADRIPGANLQMIVFSALVSGLLAEVTSLSSRLNTAALLVCYASSAQFLISITAPIPFLQITVSTLFAYFTFLTLPDLRAGCVVMLTGYLGLSAPPGFLPAIGRSIDLLAGIIIITAVTTLGNIPSKGQKNIHYVQRTSAARQALTLSAKLGIGALLAEILQLRQGMWVMMTLLFINMSKAPDSSGSRFAFQRIFAVPLGIIAGGFLLGTFYSIDNRFIWLLPFIGAMGFFILYNYGDFFLFSIIFMISLTCFSDWMAGTYHRFNFWESFFSRSIATLLGGLLELLLSQQQKIEKDSTI